MTSYLVAATEAVLDAAVANGECKGRVWKTDRFAIKRPMPGLEHGGILFVVSVDMLGFVHYRAVLNQPRYQDGAWVAAKKNVVPFGTVPMGHLGFMKDAEQSIDPKLKRRLLVPQALTDADVLVLGGAPPGVDLDDLRIAAALRPKRLDELDAHQQRQLRVAGRGHDGQDLPPTARLAPRPKASAPDAGSSFAGELELLRLADAAGKVLYEVVICGPDSGVVFRPRTTTAVAELVQGGVACNDRALKERLRRVLASRPTKKARRARG